eukprot:7924952-Alexandrium_andersonii.AAC.1
MDSCPPTKTRRSRSGIGRTPDISWWAEARWPNRIRGRWTRRQAVALATRERCAARQRQRQWHLGGGWPRSGGTRRRRAKTKGRHRNLTTRSHYGNAWARQGGMAPQVV